MLHPVRARWVQNITSLGPPTVAWTVVARWLPKTYFSVSTLELRTASSNDALSAILRKLNRDVRDTWVTEIFRCSRDGFQHSDEPLYRREYSDEDAAKRGHAEIVEALQSGKHMGALLGYKPEEVLRLSWLRAAEWLSWPAFISQPILPVLYLFWPWYYVWAWVALANLMWRFVRYRFVNYTLARVACLYVRLKWPVMGILSGYFLVHRAYLLAVLTLATPLVAMLMITLSTGMVGVVQRKFVDELLFESDLQALADAESKAQAVGN
jgi:hypothetical protein